ncbi:hypothetical protein AAVH_05026 [Aphelenchoides avenae]|nr:hypothetical protein AAVH_05026 [Aphelenchus avenae]
MAMLAEWFYPSFLMFPRRKEAIDFNTFCEKFLATGQVERIAYNAEQRLLFARLKRNAVVDGQPWTGRKTVTIEYDKAGAEADQFERDVREQQRSSDVSQAVPTIRIEGPTVIK